MLNKETQDQIAAIMLLYGTEDQKREALKYCGIKQYTEVIEKKDDSQS